MISYLCRPCNTGVCKKHKIMHEDGKQGVHSLEKLGIKLTFQEKSNIVKNLTAKIKAIDEAQMRIIIETERVMAEIQALCAYAISDLKAKKKIYANLLKRCKKRLFLYELIDISRESITSLAVNIPTYNWNGIKNFYKSTYLKEFETIDEISSINLSDAKDLLAGSYNLFLEAHKSPVTSIAISNDSKYAVSSSNDHTLRKWDLLDKRQVAILQGHTDSVTSVAITNDNRYIVSGSYDSTVRTWNLTRGSQKCVLRGHTDGVNAVAITSDGEYVVSGSMDKSLIIWNLRNKMQEAVMLGHTEAVLTLGITSDDKFIVSGSRDKTIRIWSLQDKRPDTVLLCHSNPVESLAISSDNRYIVSGGGATVRIWSLQDKMEEAVLHGHSNRVTSIAITCDNKYIVSGSWDQTIRIWSLRDRVEVHRLYEVNESVMAIAITSDNKYIISGLHEKHIVIWNLEERGKESGFEGHTSEVTSIKLSKNKRFVVSCSLDKTVRIWDLENGKHEAMLRGHRYPRLHNDTGESYQASLASSSLQKSVGELNFLDKVQKAVQGNNNNLAISIPWANGKNYFDSRSRNVSLYASQGAGTDTEIEIIFTHQALDIKWNWEDNEVTDLCDLVAF